MLKCNNVIVEYSIRLFLNMCDLKKTQKAQAQGTRGVPFFYASHFISI